MGYGGDFVNNLDKTINEFEEYKKNEKDQDKKIIFSCIVSRLYNLRTSYFADWDTYLKEKEKGK